MLTQLRFAPILRINLLAGLLLFISSEPVVLSWQVAGQNRPLPSRETRAAPPLEVRARVNQARLAVGLILVSDQPSTPPRPRGSGVVISTDGLVVTNYHVIAHDDLASEYQEFYFSLPAANAALAIGPPRYRLRKLAVDQAYDLVLLRAEPLLQAGTTAKPNAPVALPSLRLAMPNTVQTLDDLFVIGYPATGGATVTFSAGVVEGLDSNGGWIKTDARLLHGNSGGAAVNAAGLLIGIATRAELDQANGRPALGAVGFLRPAYLVAELQQRWQTQRNTPTPPRDAKAEPRPAPASRPPAPFAQASEKPPEKMVTVRGVVRVAGTSAPVAGVRVGLILADQAVTPESVIAYGGTNADGRFQLEKPVPPGRYTLRARVIEDSRYEIFNQPIEIKADNPSLLIEMRLR